MSQPTPNPEEATPICSKCGLQPSTHHICQINCGTKELLALCDECASNWKLSNAFAIPDIRNAKCDFCGAKASSGGLNQEWEKKGRGKDFHFYCTTCMKNHHHLFLKFLNTMPTDLSPIEQFERMANANDEIDEKVRALARISKN